MVRHYINLVCWREFSKYLGIFRKDSKIYCDSITMMALCKIFGATALMHRTGSTEMPTLRKLKVRDSLTVLSPFPLDFFRECEIVVPAELEDLSEYALQICKKIPKGHTVAIGIASPKQNFLAVEISKRRPDLEIFCLGAVIESFAEEATSQAVARRSNSGLEWWVHLVRSPRRGLRKISLTIIAALRILLFERNEFRRLIPYLQRH